MATRVKAIYEEGILKPLEKLDLKEGEEVEIEVKKHGITNIATNDPDFERVNGTKVWKP